MSEFSSYEELEKKLIYEINNMGFEKDIVLSALDIARILKINARTVASWRNFEDGRSPPYKKIGNTYLYPKLQFVEWLIKTEEKGKK